MSFFAASTFACASSIFAFAQASNSSVELVHSENSSMPEATPFVTAACIISTFASAIALFASNLAFALASASVAQAETFVAHACQSSLAATAFALASSNARCASSQMSSTSCSVPSSNFAPGAGNAEMHAAGSDSVKQLKHSDAEAAHFCKSEDVFVKSSSACAFAFSKQSLTSDAHT